jgi:hypothetical protein
VVAASFLVTFTIYGVSIFAFIVLIQSLAAQRGWTPADTGAGLGDVAGRPAGALGRSRWRSG